MEDGFTRGLRFLVRVCQVLPLNDCDHHANRTLALPTGLEKSTLGSVWKNNLNKLLLNHVVWWLDRTLFQRSLQTVYILVLRTTSTLLYNTHSISHHFMAGSTNGSIAPCEQTLRLTYYQTLSGTKQSLLPLSLSDFSLSRFCFFCFMHACAAKFDLHKTTRGGMVETVKTRTLTIACWKKL